MTDELIEEPIIYLRHLLEDYVSEEVIKFCDNFQLNKVNVSKCEEMCVNCDIILDKIWETINCCDWSSVQLDFRHCFGFISLIKALIQIQLLITTTDPEFEFKQKLLSLKTLDLGLLMSPKLTDNNILAKFAKYIHKSIDIQMISKS